MQLLSYCIVLIRDSAKSRNFWNYFFKFYLFLQFCEAREQIPA